MPGTCTHCRHTSSCARPGAAPGRCPRAQFAEQLSQLCFVPRRARSRPRHTRTPASAPPQGAEVCINYLGRGALRPAEERQADTAGGYAFACGCPRCNLELTSASRTSVLLQVCARAHAGGC